MLGNVGGSLGLFVGFSFSGAIGYLLNIILKIYQKWDSLFHQKVENETQNITIVATNMNEFYSKDGNELIINTEIFCTLTKVKNIFRM